MKRYAKLLFSILLVLPLVLTSCKKEPEWSNYYGFEIDNIVGHYSPSSAEVYASAFSSSIGSVYTDAQIEVTKLGPNIIKVALIIPSVYSKVFTGGIEVGTYYLQLYSHQRTETENNNGQMVVVAHYGTSFSVDVLKDDAGNIRLHGFASYRRFSPTWTIEEAYDNYYFDVTKD